MSARMGEKLVGVRRGKHDKYAQRVPFAQTVETIRQHGVMRGGFFKQHYGEHVILLSCVRRGKDTILLEGIRGFQHPIGQKKARILYSAAI